MRIHILGICGTFMAGVAVLAKQMGHEVVGSDLNVYPPMDAQLRQENINIKIGYSVENLQSIPDLVIVGNVIKRGNPAMEYILNKNIPYVSGPAWLSEQLLSKRTVLAVAGTHGKTTTSSILTWILTFANVNPGFLVGGIPGNLGVSSSLGQSPYFVIEADEYDSAFFDKRSKFVHYHPDIQILNNLEFDHADIFDNLDAIKKQFHHMVRTIPGNGCVIANAQDDNVQSVLAMGCWTPIENFNSKDGWRAENIANNGLEFDVYFKDKMLGHVEWPVAGNHNVSNALAAIAAAYHVGVDVSVSAEALRSFKQTKRRLEYKGEKNGVTVYDDFAHHPTAIAETLKALRGIVGDSRIIAVVELGSNTMKMGVHRDTLLASLKEADQFLIKTSDAVKWNVNDLSTNVLSFNEAIIQKVKSMVKSGDTILVMSNTGFNQICDELLK